MLNVTEASELLEDMQRRFWQDVRSGTRTFRSRVQKRRNLAHNLDPEWKLSGPLEKLPQFQSVDIMRKWQELRARICENHFVVRCEALKSSPSLRTAANNFESVMNTGLSLVEERNGYRLQEALADGQIVDGLAVLHWRKADDIYPAFPEAVESDVAPSMGDRDRFRRRRRSDGTYFWKETGESVQERRNVEQAKAGFPWHVEVPDVMQLMWLPDTFSDHAVVALVQEVPLTRYLEARAEEGIPLSVVESGGAFRLYRERGTIPEWSSVSSRSSIVATIWDRDNFYELAAISTGGGLSMGMAWEKIKDGPHPYKLPPFAFCPAQYVPNRPPELAYLPAMEGMFQLKDLHDRSMTLMLGMQEQAAVRKWWAEQRPDSEGLLDESGEKTINLTSDSAAADWLPAGVTLQSVDTQVTPGFVDAVKAIRETYLQAAPQTGHAEYSASTQPWTFRMAVDQANVEPRLLMDHQATALNAMARSMASVMSMSAEEGGFGEGVAVMAGGTRGNRVIISVEPEDVQSLDVSVDINATSMQERIAAAEHGRALLNDPLVPLTTIDFLEKYMHEPNPDAKYAEYKAWEMFEKQALPQILQQLVGEKLAKEFVLGPNGTFVGAGGQEVAPEQVLAANGVPASGPPGGGFPLMAPGTQGETAPPRPGPGVPVGPPQPPMMAQGANAPVMPRQGNLNVPGSMPLRG